MKKKHLLVVLAIVLVAAVAAAAGWYWHRSHDPLGLARAAMARGDLRTAQIALRSLLRAQPQSAEAHYRLGAVQLQLGDPVAAEKELKLAEAGGWNRQAVRPLLGNRIAELIGLHIDAKRYLVTTDAAYRSSLSQTSIDTLALQGGEMAADEVARFEGWTHWRAALDLRRADEAAKTPGRDVPGLETWLPALRAAARPNTHTLQEPSHGA